jgi:hypothetical protein
MRGFRPLLTAILPLLMAPVAAAQVPTGEPGFDVVGRWAPGAPAALALDGGVAYLGHGARLEAVNVGKSAASKRLGYVDFPAAVADVAVRDGYVYVITGDGVFSVVDARRPRQLRVVARLEPSDDDRYGRLELAGDLAYCAGGRLRVIDLGVPTAPRVVRTLPNSACWDVAAEGRRLYLAAWDGLHVLDSTDPRAPVPLAIVDYAETGAPVWLQAPGGLVYASTETGVLVRNLAEPANQESYLLPDTGYAHALAFAGAEVYVAGDAVTRFIGPEIVPDWMLWERGTATAIAIDGDLLVVAYRWSGLVSYELRGAGEPRQLATVETGVPVESIASDGHRLWQACNRGGVRLLDLTDPANPRRAGSLATRAGPYEPGMHAMAVSPRGDKAVVLGIGDVTMLVVEATPQGTLREIFRAPPAADGSPEPFYGAVPTSDGWIAWSEEGVSGLRLDHGGGVHLAPIAWPDSLGFPAGADGDILYARDHRGQLCLFTATAAGVIQRLGSLPASDLPSMCLSARDGLLWLGEFKDLQVVDISDPAHPRLRGRVRMPFDVRMDRIDAVAAAGPAAFVLSRGNGMMLADATDPESPILDRAWCDDSHPAAIAAVGDLACLVDWAGTMTIVRPQPRAVAAALLAPAQLAHSAVAHSAAVGLAVAPNPCNPRTTITFTVDAAGPATVRVFDARGRLVRRLHDGWLDIGAHGLTWPGDDESGRPVATGVYLVRAEAGGRLASTRVAVVR